MKEESSQSLKKFFQSKRDYKELNYFNSSQIGQ